MAGLRPRRITRLLPWLAAALVGHVQAQTQAQTPSQTPALTRSPSTAPSTAAPALSTAPAPSTAPAVYALDPQHSFVHFEVLHFGTSTSRGRFGPVQGQVTLDRARGQGEVALRIPTASVDTGLAVFNARLRQADLLDSAGHPEAFFVARQLRYDGSALAEVRGEFTLRGIGQPLSLIARQFSCRVDAGVEVCGGDFEATILRSEFGATFGLPLVGDRVRLVVQVEGRRIP
ncbi:MAG: YceI family protein [Rubrivivax sp.]|nr:YceI family protein [Rubrivivax sp.]